MAFFGAGSQTKQLYTVLYTLHQELDTDCHLLSHRWDFSSQVVRRNESHLARVAKKITW